MVGRTRKHTLASHRARADEANTGELEVDLHDSMPTRARTGRGVRPTKTMTGEVLGLSTDEVLDLGGEIGKLDIKGAKMRSGYTHGTAGLISEEKEVDSYNAFNDKKAIRQEVLGRQENFRKQAIREVRDERKYVPGRPKRGEYTIRESKLVVHPKEQVTVGTTKKSEMKVPGLHPPTQPHPSGLNNRQRRMVAFLEKKGAIPKSNFTERFNQFAHPVPISVEVDPKTIEATWYMEETPFPEPFTDLPRPQQMIERSFQGKSVITYVFDLSIVDEQRLRHAIRMPQRKRDKHHA